MSKIINLIGISETKLAPYIGRFLGCNKALILTSSEQRAKRIAGDLKFFTKSKVLVLPEADDDTLRFDAKSTAGLSARIAAYMAANEDDAFVIAPVSGALKKLPPKEVFFREVFTLRTGEEIDRQELIRKLSFMGYERSEIAEGAGQFAVRGDIVDIYASGEDEPFRVELFDTEIDSIRYFDHISQRSIKNLKEISVAPAKVLSSDDEAFARAYKKAQTLKNIEEDERSFLLGCIEEKINFQYLEKYIELFYENPEYIWDYSCAPHIFVDDPGRIAEELDEEEQELFREINLLDANVYYCTPFLQQIRFADTQDELEEIQTGQITVFGGHMDMFKSEIEGYISRGYEVCIVCQTQDRLINLRDFLARNGLDNKVNLSQGNLSVGIEFPKEKIVYITEAEIFPSTRTHLKRHGKKNQIKVFTDIKKGDYVVHEAHGIGRFVGVEKMEVQGSVRDYLRIEYAGKDVLFVPVDQMDSIQKYVGSEGVEPKVSGLSGGDWQKTKAKAKAAIMDMAEDFLKLAAERAETPGYAFGSDSSWQKEFEDAFPYEETDDQLKCTEEIKRDMQSPKAMDRLLCGDVGYGKTEVACRAIFKCLEQGKQAAVLVPTTILANQHYHTFRERFSAYPFAIEMLSRFRTASEQDKIIESIKNGDIDLVVGTHRLLSGDVKFKDLGLLVVDEEQRFGVEHKEAIKKLKSNVDVLTLSATPIPRTLHMSLTGIRDMSVIEEPPMDRYPVQTYVLEQDDRLLADAIRRELSRDGQVYVVYNRVRGIAAMARKVQALVPEAKVLVGHGQMSERELENVMMQFSSGDGNVLVATTIIESGLDIPNVNTMIIIDADHFGLSQLYQLRGRVGRSNRIAYAYLMYKKDKVLSEIAEKRLRAIKEFTEFGSGFRVAMRDLELRGAGNVLGVEQSGHMMQIGYELYCKLVDEAIRELKGEEPELPMADASVELSLPAYIPEEYISNEVLKLDMYKRIAAMNSEEDKMEVLDELTDRFGDPPKPTLNLLEIALIHNYASKCGVEKLVAQQDQIVLVFAEQSLLGPKVFAKLMDSYALRLTIYGGQPPRISLFIGDKNAAEEVKKLLSAMLAAAKE